MFSVYNINHRIVYKVDKLGDKFQRASLGYAYVTIQDIANLADVIDKDLVTVLNYFIYGKPSKSATNMFEREEVLQAIVNCLLGEIYARRLNPSRVSNMLGISKMTLSRYFNFQTDFPMHHIYHITHIINIPLHVVYLRALENLRWESILSQRM